MCPVTQACGGERPQAGPVSRSTAQQHAAVKHIHAGSGFRRTCKRQRVIGRDAVQQRARIGGEGGDHRLLRCRRINADRIDVGFRAHGPRSIRRNHGEVVRTVCQRLGGEAPHARGARCHPSKRHAAVKDLDLRQRVCGAAQGQRGIRRQAVTSNTRVSRVAEDGGRRNLRHFFLVACARHALEVRPGASVLGAEAIRPERRPVGAALVPLAIQRRPVEKLQETVRQRTIKTRCADACRGRGNGIQLFRRKAADTDLSFRPAQHQIAVFHAGIVRAFKRHQFGNHA